MAQRRTRHRRTRTPLTTPAHVVRVQSITLPELAHLPALAHTCPPSSTCARHCARRGSLTHTPPHKVAAAHRAAWSAANVRPWRLRRSGRCTRKCGLSGFAATSAHNQMFRTHAHACQDETCISGCGTQPIRVKVANTCGASWVQVANTLGCAPAAMIERRAVTHSICMQ
jgi:hypothetical protein